MHQVTVVALVAAISFGSAALAQQTTVDASASASASVSASVPDVSSTLSSASSEVSSALSSASSDVSSALSSTSSELGSTSSSQMSSMASNQGCGNLTAGSITTSAIDPSVLSAVTNVQVFSIAQCADVSGLAAMDAVVSATIAANPTVTAAMQAQGESGSEIVGYGVDGTTLIVYVRHKA